MPVKQITNRTVFSEIKTANRTFIACLTRFRLNTHPLENLHRIPTGFPTIPCRAPEGKQIVLRYRTSSSRQWLQYVVEEVSAFTVPSTLSCRSTKILSSQAYAVCWGDTS